MFRQLLAVFRSDNPMHGVGVDFVRMIRLTEDMTRSAGHLFLGDQAAVLDRAHLYEFDVQVNKLERDIRKRVVAHLSIPGNNSDAAFSLLLMSLIKDVERIGDYAKNVAEIADLMTVPVPSDDVGQELRSLREQVEAFFGGAAESFATSDRERALALIEKSRGIAIRCDALIPRVVQADYNAATTAALVLAARYYKRINGHLLNVLSSVVMPVHKVDYYDEDEIPKDTRQP
jgi:phosphate uptake regulator